MEIGTADVEAVIDMSIGDEVRAHINDGICMGVEVAASDIREGEEEFEAEASAGGTIKVEVDLRVKSVVNKDVPDHVIADGAVKVTYETLGDLVHRFHDHTEEILVHQFRDRVDSLRHHMALSQEEFCQIYRDRDDLEGDLEDWSRLLRGVMATPVIPISLDFSEESVGSHVPRVILFGALPAIILVILEVLTEVPIIHANPLVAPKVGPVSITSPTGVLDLVDYSSSDSDPSEDSLPPAPELPLAVPFGRPYRIHLNRPRKLLTARKRVPARRLSWRRVSHHSSDHRSSPNFTLDSSSSGSSLDSSSVHSLGRGASGQTHSGPSTRVASSRLVFPIMTLRYSKAFSH
uniref:Uncharacterized protein n=1 Tax=Tanacetum cinerariifolium TaxID=118510 RepID=A0A699IRV1_TANCI|nr:hypothetical protein [Tanacetum cinerariifolium]